MKIEHIAIYTNDLEKLKDFYVRYFAGVANQKYTSKSGLTTYFIAFEGGARLEIMSLPQPLPAAPNAHTGWAHLAFNVGTREDVDALTQRLKQDGYTVKRPPRVTGDGYYESVVLDPDGNALEITADATSVR